MPASTDVTTLTPNSNEASITIQMSKAAIVFGVANQRSLAWSATLALLNQANFDHIIVTYQNDRHKAAVEKLVDDQNAYLKNCLSLSTSREEQQYSPKIISSLQCDVSLENDVKVLFTDRLPSLLCMQLRNKGISHQREIKLDALVHSVAFAPADAMKGDETLPLLNTSHDAFVTAHVISAYSLLAVSKYALNLLSCHTIDEEGKNVHKQKRSPSITALSYIGSSRAVRNYNVMGPAKASLESIVRGLALELGPEPHSIRVNCVSSGPVNTLAARGIKGFVEMKQDAAKKSCLNRNVTSDEVASLVAFLADGERSSGITGQTVFCDSGFSSTAM